jgi:hypothetical protein
VSSSSSCAWPLVLLVVSDDRPTMSLVDVDVRLDDELDFESVLPCEGLMHEFGTFGHRPYQDGSFVVVSPCCGTRCVQCAGRVAFMRETTAMNCGSCGHDWPPTKYRFIPLEDV